MAKKIVIFTTHESQADFLATVLEHKLNDKGVKRVETTTVDQRGDLITVVIVGDTEAYNGYPRAEAG